MKTILFRKRRRVFAVVLLLATLLGSCAQSTEPRKADEYLGEKSVVSS